MERHTHDKKTDRDESTELPSATLGDRIRAFGYDLLLIGAYIAVLAGINVALILPLEIQENYFPEFDPAVFWDLIAFFTLILPVILYFSLGECSPSQATWGKHKMGLLVVDPKGKRLSFGKTFLRAGIKFLPWQAAHTSVYHIMFSQPGDPGVKIAGVGFAITYLLVGFYLVTALISHKNRTPYDWAAGSFVIVSKSKLSLSKVE